MELLIKMLEDYGGTFIFIMFLCFILVVLGIIAVIFKIKELLDKYHNKQRKAEKKDDAIDDRFSAIEAAQKEDHDEIMALKEEVDGIRKLIENLQLTQEKTDAAQKKANRAQSRSSIMRLSNELISRGYMSEIESETLNDLVSVFMQSASENDSYVVPNIAARALKLPVLTMEEIDIMQRKEASHNFGVRRKKRPTI